MRFASVGKNEDLEDDFSRVKYFTLSYAHNNTIIKLLRYFSLEEEDFREISLSDDKPDIKNWDISNCNSDSYQNEMISTNVMSDEVNHSKEKDTMSASGIET